MAQNASVVNKIQVSVIIWSVIIAIMCQFSGIAQAKGAYTVSPVEKSGDVRLLPSQAWPPPEADHGQLLIKLYYLRGILDALQYVELDPDSAARTLRALKGLELNRLAGEVDKYYLSDPKHRDTPPAAVVLRILSAAKTGK
jgi:hypothetical protein